ncbi:MAG: hypothetical protein HOP13_02300 [Alphaproteobacteria bacterium]|nr:hypothetical protein [Alphaproteobacteria bacterium]
MQNENAPEAWKIMQGDPAEAQASFVAKARIVFRDAAGEPIPVQLIAGSLFVPALHVLATLSLTMQLALGERLQKGEVQIAPDNARSAFEAKGLDLFGDSARELTDIQIVDLALLTTQACAGAPPPRREAGARVDA